MPNNSQNIKPGQRLKTARESLKGANDKKLTQQMFAKGIGYSRNTLGKWEQCLEDIPEELYEVFKKVYGINPLWLRDGQEPIFLPTFSGKGAIDFGGEAEMGDARELVKQELRNQVTATINKSNHHPGIRVWALAGGGDPWEPDDSEPIELIDPAVMINPRYRDALRIWGESMTPVIRHNALVFCDFNDKRIRSGEIYALNVPSEGLVVKELRIVKQQEDTPSRIMAYSYNEARYAPAYYSHEELEQSNIVIGRIISIYQETNK